jgi:hypothetical protein
LAPDDDDGNAAVRNAPRREPQHDPETGEVLAITEAQELTLRDLLGATGADEGKFLSFFRIAKLMELPADKFGEAERMLLAKQKAAA